MNPRIAFQTIWDRCQHTAEVYDALKYLQALAEMPSEKQWILCSERLPDKDGYYLVTREKWSSDGLQTGTAIFVKSTNSFYPECIAWMPLPEPYKKEGD